MTDKAVVVWVVTHTYDECETRHDGKEAMRVLESKFFARERFDIFFCGSTFLGTRDLESCVVCDNFCRSKSRKRDHPRTADHYKQP